MKAVLFKKSYFGCLLFLDLVACQQENINPNQAVTTLFITQEQLDAVTLVHRSSDLAITGAPFRNRNNDSTRFYIRDIFSNVPANQSLNTGSIIAIRAYEKVNNHRGKLKLVDIMVKLESSYNAAGGSFEYIQIKYGANTDYSLHPNGLLPDLLQTDSRGLDVVVSPESCVSCH
ncbi:MAG: hypothetical protein COW65_16395 [Cytophagales bacterium CG18_big_fil_WC_8_21_14_2_50_42_9]|nr:MAG: hypothetical protein COW65_16395 [Cytophagales bacterium CG18_big_fil_WC_8_21_14_2_50_42_9]